MEEITNSILTEWRSLNRTKAFISELKVKHQDRELGIYTLYFNAGKVKIRIKAIKNEDSWKIIDMT